MPAIPTSNANATSRYVPALDGLRAFAVLAVVAYHMHLAWAPGGLVGVTIFFVLSGYLITGILQKEWLCSGRLNLPSFWARRIRRLFPAIIFVVIASIILFLIIDHSLLTKLRTDVGAALLWMANWWYIFHNLSYFNALGSPSPLTHFWSLAIEEQFYLVWPLLLVLAYKMKVKRRTLCALTITLALGSALEMALLFSPTADPSRVYYGTDTRAFSLLLGAALAFIWPDHLSSLRRRLAQSACLRGLFNAGGIISLIGLGILLVFIPDFSSFWYYGGTLLASLLSIVVIMVLTQKNTLLARAASNKIAVWIGLRSYSIYLWHFPLLLAFTQPNATGKTPWWLHLIELAVIFACAAFSYRFIENPLRHGALKKFTASLRSGRTGFSGWAGAHLSQLIFGGACLAVALGALIFVPSTSALKDADQLKQSGAHATTTSPPATTTPSPTDDTQALGTPQHPVLDVLLIGDSVSVRAAPAFEKVFPFGAIDAARDRQLFAGKEVYLHYADQHIVGSVVIFALGTNGPATDEQIDDLVAATGSNRQVFFITTRSPRSWVDATNDSLARAVQRHTNVHLIDWYAKSENHDDYFDGDGTHLNEEGVAAYVAMIREHIAPLLPTHPLGDKAAVLTSPSE